jgi:hypothetical protein
MHFLVDLKSQIREGMGVAGDLATILFHKFLEEALQPAQQLLVGHGDPDVVQDGVHGNGVAVANVAKELHRDDGPHFIVLATGAGVLGAREGVHVPEIDSFKFC